MKDLDPKRLRNLAFRLVEWPVLFEDHQEAADALNAVAEHLEEQQTGEDPLAGIKEVSDDLQSLADEAERGNRKETDND